jgi:2-isopropylmalate synthase
VNSNPSPSPDSLIFDWNGEVASLGAVEILDDTLRDGLQNASARQPSTAERREFLHAMVEVGVDAANLGLPAAGQRAFDDCLALCREVADARLPLSVACAGRTLTSDLIPIVELSQKSGLRLEAHTFLGSSPIRAHAERWDEDSLKRRTESSVSLLARAGLPVTFVTEDTTRSRPELLEALFAVAFDAGAERLCLCDTVGHATPPGVTRLVRFARSVIERSGRSIALDWHGHNDRGLALANALAAASAGVDRVHATALGIGERVGNTPLELVALNLALAGSFRGDPRALPGYAARASRTLGWPIPPNYPLVGENAFRTATGVHAAAILKAKALGGDLADRVYSGVPAGLFGREQEVCIGAMSGSSNVVYWLTSRGITATDELVKKILERAKVSDHLLGEQEILSLVGSER